MKTKSKEYRQRETRGNKERDREREGKRESGEERERVKVRCYRNEKGGRFYSLLISWNSEFKSINVYF